MLVELAVENYAVVERIRVRFHRGLNLLTGETGSGKSIVVDALGLVYGGRASGDVVRSGAAAARITAIFETPSSPAFREFAESRGIESEDGELIVEREIQASGKSRAFVSSRPVTAAVLRELAPFLGDIHGQHDQQELFSADAQLELVDGYASSGAALEAVAAVFTRWQACERELEELDLSEQEKLRLADLWLFQRREIEEAAPRPGEDAELEAERRVLMNVARLQENAEAACTALYDAPESVLAMLRQARRRIEELCRIDPQLKETAESLVPAEIAIDEAARTLRHYLGNLEADPRRLEHIESRLALLEKLKRKYGATVEEVLAFLGDVAAKLDAVEHATERRERLTAERESLGKEYTLRAARLSELRKTASRELEKNVERELSALAMGGSVFRVEFSEGGWSARGVDRVRFQISPNAGEEPRPLEKTASGGELSRLALALKTTLAARHTAAKSRETLRTLVFDEVDTGIGGRTADSVGRRLKRLAAANQLLCVTHLAQIASFADHHYAVSKKETKGRTVAEIAQLDEPGRREEIARMLSGDRLTPEALSQAEQLMKAGATA